MKRPRRVLLDANVLISYLLEPSSTRTITRVVEACTAPGIDLLWPPELGDEVSGGIHRSPYLRERITPELVDSFLDALTAIAEPLPDLPSVEAVSRDPKDDYLVAYGLVYAADALVTGDSDLLVLERVHDLHIVSPARFLQALQAAGKVDE